MDTNENAGLFEWQDGLLVRSMKGGALFLIDEISLADDSVLERLNSVLEPEKELVLAEKGYQDDDRHIDIIRAHEKFRLIATMNPGGDFGKKEVRVEHHRLAFNEHVCRFLSLLQLSPALRNRFTEIWCTPSESTADFDAIIRHNLTLADEVQRQQCSQAICDFIEYLRTVSMSKR